MQDTTIGSIQVPPEMLIGSGSQLEGKVHAAQNSAGEKQKSELRKVAQEFEAVFIAHLLKVMRETIEESGLMEEGFGKSMYTEMFDQELSLSMARRGALGISDLLYQNLLKTETKKELKDSSQAPASPQGVGNGASNQTEDQEISDLQLPVLAPVSSPFGPRVDPYSHKMRLHKGVDLAAPKGMAIAAPLSGTVVSAGYENGYGNAILIQHSDGLQTRYAHLGSINVKAGEKISEQQVLGTVGETGRSTGPHLHFEVIRMGKQVDPLLTIEPGTANLENRNTKSRRL
jgi:murein DD-endopeptidase MepM/ murein hydrolase activator NlpD